MVGFAVRAIIQGRRGVWHSYRQPVSSRASVIKSRNPNVGQAQKLIRIELGKLTQAQLANFRRCAGVKESTLDTNNRGFLLTEDKLDKLKKDPRFARLLKQRLR